MKISAGYKHQKWSDPTEFYSIPYSIESAYTNLDNANKNKQVLGFEPNMKTDFTGSAVTMKAAADFGRKVSAASSVALLDGHQIPHYAVGVQGSYLQYRLEGDADQASTDGLEIYAMGAAIK